MRFKLLRRSTNYNFGQVFSRDALSGHNVSWKLQLKKRSRGEIHRVIRFFFYIKHSIVRVWDAHIVDIAVARVQRGKLDTRPLADHWQRPQIHIGGIGQSVSWIIEATSRRNCIHVGTIVRCPSSLRPSAFPFSPHVSGVRRARSGGVREHTLCNGRVFRDFLTLAFAKSNWNIDDRLLDMWQKTIKNMIADQSWIVERL